MQEFTSLLQLYDLPTDGPIAKSFKIAAINNAQHTIHERMFGFTSKDVADAFIAAQNRGVTVLFLLDHLQSLGPVEAQLLHAMMLSIPPKNFCITTSVFHQFMHDKITVIDGLCEKPDAVYATMADALADHYPITITGSTNETEVAYRQANQMIVMPGKSLATIYIKSFQDQWDFAMATEAQYQKAS